LTAPITLCTLRGEMRTYFETALTSMSLTLFAYL
jgi:hypothetical protein